MPHFSTITSIFALLLAMVLQNCGNQSATTAKIIDNIYENEIRFTDGSKERIPYADDENATIFFLLRHAEKQKTGDDPDLNEAGKARAQRLANMVQNADLDRIYANTTKRVFQTVFPTVKSTTIKHGSYRNDKIPDFMETILEYEKNTRILIVGHSNTIPEMMNLLLDKKVYETIPETEYSHFYIVAVKEKGDAKVLELRY